MDDFALASWSLIVELLKRLEVEGVLDRSDVMEVLDAAANVRSDTAICTRAPGTASFRS
jgi:hypothetical protein